MSQFQTSTSSNVHPSTCALCLPSLLLISFLIKSSAYCRISPFMRKSVCGIIYTTWNAIGTFRTPKAFRRAVDRTSASNSYLPTAYETLVRETNAQLKKIPLPVISLRSDYCVVSEDLSSWVGNFMYQNNPIE